MTDRNRAADGGDCGRAPVCDGGLTLQEGIKPAEADELVAFLEEHGPHGYELTYEDGVERTVVLHELAMREMSLKRPSAAPAVRCTPVAPGEAEFSIRVDAIRAVSVVDPPHAMYRNAEDLEQEATGLRRLADLDPRAVEIQELFELLEAAMETDPWARDVLRAVRPVARERPRECSPLLPALQSLLGSGDAEIRTEVLRVLRAIGDGSAADIAWLTENIIAQLDADDESVRRQAIRCLVPIAEEDPGDVIDAVPKLAPIMEADATAERHAMFVLSRISKEYPEQIKPFAERLGDVLLDDTRADEVRLNAAAALGRVCGEYPATADDIFDDVATLLESENPMLRNNAVGFMSDVATLKSDLLEPYTDAIAELLEGDDEYARTNASCALSRVAVDFPASVEPYTETFVDLLSDDASLVRLNACWALGHLEAAEAESALEEVAASDGDSDVRLRANWALQQIDALEQA